MKGSSSIETRDEHRVQAGASPAAALWGGDATGRAVQDAPSRAAVLAAEDQLILFPTTCSLQVTP